MSSKKQKERKKKKREEIARHRVLKRRAEIRKERKDAIEEQAKQQTAEDAIYGKLKPYVRKDDPLIKELTENEKKEKNNEIQSKIEHNLKILEALEEEYDKEQALRKQMNEKLEKEGHKTIKEKMDALHQKALEIEGKKEEYENAQKEYSEEKK
jgi:hypothetical protein